MRYDADTGAPIGKIDHFAEGAALMPDKLRKPFIMVLLATYLKQVQALEDAAWQLFTLRFLANATGAALDDWGAIVDEPRNSDLDDFYRIRITIKALVNRSRGNFTDLRKLALLAFGHDVFVVWAHRKTVVVYVFRPYHTAATRAQVLRWFQLAKVAGDGFRLYQSADAGPLIVSHSSSPTIPVLGMQHSSLPFTGGRLMGEF